MSLTAWQRHTETLQAAKGQNRGAAEIGSEMETQAIMQAKEIKAARLKDKSAVKSEVQLYEGDWQVIDKKKRHKTCEWQRNKRGICSVRNGIFKTGFGI